MTPVTIEVVRSPSQFEEALSIRFEVFVDEQQVPREEEQDSEDDSAHHVLARTPDGVPVATGRFLWADPQTVKIGRIAVLARGRKQGWGRQVMDALEAAARQGGALEAVLGAQLQAQGFYERMGYVPEGPVFLECEIEHRKMRKHLGSPLDDEVH